MPDFTLHGNHDPCPACALRREALAEAGGGGGADPVRAGRMQQLRGHRHDRADRPRNHRPHRERSLQAALACF